MNDFNNSVFYFVPGENHVPVVVGGVPTGGILLGTDDGYVNVGETAETRVFTYTGFYAVDPQTTRLAGNYTNTSANRAAAELYLSKLVDSLGGITTLQREPNGPNEYIALPSSGATAGTLYNPYTYNEHSVSDREYFHNCYLTRARTRDVGNFYYEFTLTFEVPKSGELAASGAGGLLEYKENQIGNRGGFLNVSSLTPFTIEYESTSYYTGANPANYLATLADTLGLDPLVSFEMPLASAGSRTAYVSCSNSAGNVVRFTDDGTTRTAVETISSLFLTGLEGDVSDEGILTINATFEKSR